MRSTNHYLRPLGLLLLLCLIPFSAFAQQAITVKGVVTDASFGDPVIGASVIQVNNAGNGTITNIDGAFSINVPADATIRISFIGYKAQEIAVNGRTSISVKLEEDSEMLDEVVVVGYGQMKRSDLTGSVVSVNSEAISKSIPTSIDQVLQGRAAGVQIQANSGTPGASNSINIRGINSLSISNQPIFVIDGIVIDTASDTDSNNPLSSINPSDIESMDILKDASATAIYGARASNGVIIITTKRGKAGVSTINYDGYVGWQTMPKQLDMMNLREYAAHHNDRSQAQIVNPSNLFINPELLADGTNWQSELFQAAMMTSHNLSITGGNEKTQYAISAGYLNQEGIAVGSSFRRLALRGNVDTEVRSWLKAGINFSLSDSKQEVGTDNDNIMSALLQQPSVAVTMPDGSFDGPDDQWMPINPIGIASMVENYNKKYNFRFNTYLEATIIDGLTFKTEVSTDYSWANSYWFQPSYKFGVLESSTRTSRRTKNDSQYWAWRNFLTYNKTLGEVHNINAMLGQEITESKWEYLQGAATGFLTNSTHDINAGDRSKSSATGTTGASSIASFFGRAFYSYNDRYLLTATLRHDGSSKFARGNRWGWFPSAALAWKVSNEEFMQPVTDVMNGLKLRLGWGATGNQNIEDWAYMGMLASRATPWGSGVLTANTPNPELKWETTYSTNIGLDVNLFNNRVELIADVYYKKTTDLLLKLALPATFGSVGHGAAANPWQNIGELENKGVELTLNTVNIDTRDFQWRSNFVFSLNRNKVLSLDTDNASIEKSFQFGSDSQIITKTVVGESIGQFWGYKVIGRFDKPEDFYYKDAAGNVKQVALPEGCAIGVSDTWLGDYRFADLSGPNGEPDGVINHYDCDFIGNPEPAFTYGIGNTFSWKGFDLTIFLSGSYGNDAVNYNRRRIEDPRLNNNLLSKVRNYARVEKIDPNGPEDFRNMHVTGGDPYMPRLSASSKNGNYRMSDRLIEDASYLRIQNISLAYTLPRKLVTKLGLQNLKVYANLQNVYTWTNYSGFDPEIGAMWGDALMSGLDYGRYPSPRIYTFGLNVSF